MPDGDQTPHMSLEAKGEFNKVHREARTNMTISAGTALALIAFLFTGWTWASEAHQRNSETVAVERARNDKQAKELDDLRDDLEVVNDRVNDTTINSQVTIRLLNELKGDVSELSAEIRRYRQEN